MSESPVWEEGTWSAFPALEGDVTADVCVVGLGGSGLTCILELLRLGQRVVGIDAGMVGGGAAGRNGGFLLAGLAEFYHDAVTALGRDRARAMYALTLAELDRMTGETPAAVRRVGSLRIADDASELADCETHFAALTADHFPVERYDGPEGRGLLIATDGAFDPLRRCRALARRASERGARLFEQSPAREIGGTRVQCPAGQVRCRHVVVAVDGGLELLLPELAGRVRTARLQMLATAPARDVTIPRPVYRRWSYDYWQQLPDGRIALGGCRDRGGEAEWTADAVPTAPVQKELDQLLRQHVRTSAPVTHRWAGAVGYSTDGVPVIDQVRENVWAIGGYSGTGNIVGAICGRGVAQLVVTGASPLVAPFRSRG